MDNDMKTQFGCFPCELTHRKQPSMLAGCRWDDEPNEDLAAVICGILGGLIFVLIGLFVLV